MKVRDHLQNKQKHPCIAVPPLAPVVERCLRRLLLSLLIETVEASVKEAGEDDIIETNNDLIDYSHADALQTFSIQTRKIPSATTAHK